MYMPKARLKKIMSKYSQNISEYFDSDDMQNAFSFISDRSSHMCKARDEQSVL